MNFIMRLVIGLKVLIVCCVTVHWYFAPEPDLFADCLAHSPGGEHGCADVVGEWGAARFLVTVWTALIGGLLLVFLSLDALFRNSPAE